MKPFVSGIDITAGAVLQLDCMCAGWYTSNTKFTHYILYVWFFTCVQINKLHAGSAVVSSYQLHVQLLQLGVYKGNTAV